MRLLTCILSIICFPQLCEAQKEAQKEVQKKSRLNQPTSVFDWYLGFNPVGHHYLEVKIAGSVPGLTGVGPYVLNVGKRLSPRLTLQASCAFNYFTNSRTTYGTDLAGNAVAKYFYNKGTGQAFPILLRYQLTRQATKRIKFDALGGLKVLNYHDEFKFEERVNQQVVQTNARSRQAVNFYLIAGVAANYQISRRFQFEISGILNKNLHGIDQTFSQQNLNSTLGFQRGWNVGINYFFNFTNRLPTEDKE